MKQRLIIPLLLLCLALLGACSAPGADENSLSQASAPPSSITSTGSGAYQKISATEAKELMEQGGVTIVDVRTAGEYEEKHIKGALLLPVESIKESPPKQLPNKDATLLVYCRTGVRSRSASEKLISVGYRNVYDFGGIVDWPYETVAGGEKS